MIFFVFCGLLLIWIYYNAIIIQYPFSFVTIFLDKDEEFQKNILLH